MLIRVFSFICKTSFEMLVLKRNLNYQYENKYDVLENTRKNKITGPLMEWMVDVFLGNWCKDDDDDDDDYYYY